MDHQIVFRNGLNRDSYYVSAIVSNSRIQIIREDYINGFYVKSDVTYQYPVFNTVEEADRFIETLAENSTIEDQQFMYSFS